MRILPSLMCADLFALGEQIDRLEGSVNGWHVDIMDGQFVPNITLGFDLIDQLKERTRLPIEVHLMVKEPLRYIDRVGEVDKIFVHVESIDDGTTLTKNYHNIGIAINIETDSKSIPSWVFEYQNFLIMGVPAGFSGQKFNNSVLSTISAIRLNASRVQSICVDGGANKDTIPSIIEAGADSIVVGTSIFRQKDIISATQELRRGAFV